jgi:tetratricopeptide (TPR) repeat protein
MLYGNLGDFNKAYEYFLKGLKALGTHSDIALHGTLNSNLYASISNLDSLNSLEIFNNSLAFFKQIQDSSSISRLYNNHSYILAKTNQIDSALKTNELAISFSSSDQNNTFNALYQKGFLFYDKIKDYQTAEETFLECLEVVPKYRDLRFEYLIYNHLSQIEHKRENYKKALIYFNKHVELKDSLTGDGIKKDILSIELQSQIKEQELKASILQKENEIEQRNSFFQKTILFVILIILVLLIIIIYVINKNLQKKNKVKELEKIRLEEQILIDQKAREVESLRQKEKLNIKNKELTAFSLKLIAKNDILKKISKLSDQYYDKDMLEKQYYNELSSIIDNNANVEKEWEYFKVLFEKVHQDFFKKLRTFNASLTPLDYKLSAFIKVNMSTREIAQILNIEVDSVTMAKHRLKKKLGLEKHIKVDQFIQQL